MNSRVNVKVPEKSNLLKSSSSGVTLRYSLNTATEIVKPMIRKRNHMSVEAPSNSTKIIPENNPVSVPVITFV